jgi:hypothetical protein
MPLGERVSAETRLKTGWLIPVVALSTLRTFASIPEMPLGSRDEMLLAALAIGGVLIGALWQWYSPRPIGYRLVLPALLFLLSPVVLLVPLGEVRFQPGLLIFGANIVAGVVLVDVWQRNRALGAAQD